MTMRTIPTILDEWRAAERDLEAATDDESREATVSRIAALHAEHAAALETRERDAHALSGHPSLHDEAEA